MSKPFVSIIVPCYQEAAFIEGVIQDVLQQDYPNEQIETFFVDGGSTDGTIEKIKTASQQYPFIRLIENPDRYVPQAMNRGIAAARGSIIIRLDAHAGYPKDYVSKLVGWSERSGADNVGGLWRIAPRGDHPRAQAIAAVLAHPLGVGNASYRLGVEQASEVDTVPFGCFRREVFERYGFYDSRLHRNQDIELNRRIRRKGGRIILVPDVWCTYYARSTYPALWRNNFANGKWVILTARLTRTFDSLSLRHFAPLFFVLYWLSTMGLMLSLSLAPALGWMPLLWVFPGLLYLALIFWASIKLAFSRRQVLHFIYYFLAFLTLHFSYGWGSIAGLFAPIKSSQEPK